MRHTIEVISIEQHRDEHNNRAFSALIDGMKIEGKVQRIIMNRNIPVTAWKYQYRMYFPKDILITKHSDYKNIRRELLTKMIKKRPYEMLNVEQVVR